MQAGQELKRSTRWEILEVLQRKGQATVLELSTALELAPTGIRQHLMLLQRDALVAWLTSILKCARWK